MWLKCLILLSFTAFDTHQEQCSIDFESFKIKAITEMKRVDGQDHIAYLFTEDQVIKFTHMTYTGSYNIIQIKSVECFRIEYSIDPQQLTDFITVVGLLVDLPRFLALIMDPEKASNVNYEVFEGDANSKFSMLDKQQWQSEWSEFTQFLDNLGSEHIKAIINGYTTGHVNYLVVYSRQPGDDETGVNIFDHRTKLPTKLVHQKYDGQCSVIAATGIHGNDVDNFYGIEIFDDKYILRRYFVKPTDVLNNCMDGVLMQGSISEFFGGHPDPCKGSRLDVVIPFDQWKMVVFGRWFYKTKYGIRTKDRQWVRLTWDHPFYSSGHQYDSEIQLGTFVDAAFFWKKSKETYVFFRNKYFAMASINDHAGESKPRTDKFNIEIHDAERLTAAFMDDETDEAYLFSGSKFWVVSMDRKNGERIRSQSTYSLFGRERNVDAVDVDDRYFYFFDGDEHFTYEKSALQNQVFRSAPSANMKNRDHIFMCYTVKDPFHSKYTKWIIVALMLLLLFALFVTRYVFDYIEKELKLQNLKQSQSPTSAVSPSAVSAISKISKA